MDLRENVEQNTNELFIYREITKMSYQRSKTLLKLKILNDYSHSIVPPKRLVKKTVIAMGLNQ